MNHARGSVFLLGAGGFIGRIIADAGAARASFGWMSIVPLDSGLQRTWQWFNNRD